MSAAGRLITFEGGEGAGKTTQIRRLAQRLEAAGRPVVTSREPGGTPGAEAIRQLLVTGTAERWTPVVEAFLHTAARADHVERWIRPKLASGALVLLDRFIDSTRVYQGLAGGVDVEQIDRLQAIAFGDLRPDLTVLLDLPVAQGLARAAGRAGDDRYEGMGHAYHERVRQGFLGLARAEPERFAIIDASRTEDAVAAQIEAAVTTRLRLTGPQVTP